MTRESCDAFLADPEANKAHIESCESCRQAMSKLQALDAGLAAVAVEPEGATVPDPEALPIAAWEGASNRPWSLVVGVALFVSILGIGGFMMLGIPPIQGFIAATTGALPGGGFLKIVKSAPDFLANAPMHIHALIIIAFVVVNILFFSLLRRRTRGYDV